MSERMLGKEDEPSLEAIKSYLGDEGYRLLEGFEDRISQSYHALRELKYPFGDKYGWGYKYSFKSSHLCHVFFEKGSFAVFFQIGDKSVPLLKERLNELNDKAVEAWSKRYPCGEEGGWVTIRPDSDEDIESIIKMLYTRKKPPKS